MSTIPPERCVPFHSASKTQLASLNLVRCVCQTVSVTMLHVHAGGANGAAPATGPGTDFLPLLRANLSKLVATNKLEAFYPPQRLEEVLAALAQVDFRCKVPTAKSHTRSGVTAGLLSYEKPGSDASLDEGPVS